MDTIDSIIRKHTFKLRHLIYVILLFITTKDSNFKGHSSLLESGQSNGRNIAGIQPPRPSKVDRLTLMVRSDNSGKEGGDGDILGWGDKNVESGKGWKKPPPSAGE
ncbi:hypothetical protein LXL04_035688 [Taraxacum kok-saghyz]